MEKDTTARDTLSRYVRSGFYSADEIARIVTESVYWRTEVAPGWLRSEIEQALQQKRAEERSWPAVTDCSRLDAVFESLSGEGILAVQNAGYTLSDGLDDVAQRYREAGGEQSGVVGFCFYHGQDLESVMDCGELCLAFGATDGETDAGVEVGDRIRKAFEAAGFTVEWNGSFETRLRITGIKWQRRSPPEAEPGAAPDPAT